MDNYYTYSLNIVEINGINLMSGKVIKNPLLPLITEKHDRSDPKGTLEYHKGK